MRRSTPDGPRSAASGGSLLAGADSPGTAGRDESAAGTQAIRRSLKILDLFCRSQADLGVAEVADTLDLRPSTAHRMMRALVSGGLLVQNPETERYYLGRAAVMLGMAAQRNLGLTSAMPVLERLAAASGEAVNLGIREGTSAVVMLRVESSQPLRLHMPPGTRVPLHASAMGKSLLAFADGPDVAGAYLAATGGRLTTYTANTVTTIRELRQELMLVRERGYAFDDEESIAGVRCVGAPILDGMQQARAAIAVQAPSVHVPDDRVEALAAQVLDTAKEISGLLPPGKVL